VNVFLQRQGAHFNLRHSRTFLTTFRVKAVAIEGIQITTVSEGEEMKPNGKETSFAKITKLSVPTRARSTLLLGNAFLQRAPFVI